MRILLIACLLSVLLIPTGSFALSDRDVEEMFYSDLEDGTIVSVGEEVTFMSADMFAEKEEVKYFCPVHGDFQVDIWDFSSLLSVTTKDGKETTHCPECYYEWIRENVSEILEVE